MTDEAETAPLPASATASEPDRARSRAPATTRRRKRIERREAYFDLLASGYSYRQIAEAMEVTPLSVRRAVDRAIAERRLDAPDRYVHLQVARLSKALRAADMRNREGRPQGRRALRPGRRGARPLSRARRQISPVSRPAGAGGVCGRPAAAAGARPRASRESIATLQSRADRRAGARTLQAQSKVFGQGFAAVNTLKSCY